MSKEGEDDREIHLLPSHSFILPLLFLFIVFLRPKGRIETIQSVKPVSKRLGTESLLLKPFLLAHHQHTLDRVCRIRLDVQRHEPFHFRHLLRLQ